MKNWIMGWIANIIALGIILAGYWMTRDPNHFHPKTTPGIWADGPVAILEAVLILSLANTIIRPIVMFFAWPINCLTFGLLGFVLNVLLFMLVGNLGFGFYVNGPIAALIGSVAMGALSGALSSLLHDSGKRKRKKDD